MRHDGEDLALALRQAARSYADDTGATPGAIEAALVELVRCDVGLAEHPVLSGALARVMDRPKK